MSSVGEDEFKQAYVTLKSRCINWTFPSGHPIPDWFRKTAPHCCALAPVFDLWNHNSKPNCKWEGTTYDGSRGSFQIRVTDKIDLGTELFISYGNSASTNVKTAMSYGYTTSDLKQLKIKIKFRVATCSTTQNMYRWLCLGLLFVT